MGHTHGRRLYDDLLRSSTREETQLALDGWLDIAGQSCRSLVDRVRTAPDVALDEPPAPRRRLDEALLSVLFELYALSRVDDVLRGCLPQQAVPESSRLAFWEDLGVRPVESSTFDPFLHEIVEVDQAPDPTEPVTVTAVDRSALMAGDMLFSRALVRVRAGACHARRGWADASPLYWTFARRNRQPVDLSHGWGSNSQWATTFRRDYRTAVADVLNIDETGSLASIGAHPLDDLHELLAPDERRDLVRHRCLVVPPAAVADLDEKLQSWPDNLWPFDWKVTIPNPGHPQI